MIASVVSEKTETIYAFTEGRDFSIQFIYNGKRMEGTFTVRKCDRKENSGEPSTGYTCCIAPVAPPQKELWHTTHHAHSTQQSPFLTRGFGGS